MRAFLHDRNPAHLAWHQRLYGWVLRHNELHLALLIAGSWYPIQWLMAWYFPDAAPLSSTQLHKLLLTAEVFTFAHGYLWLGLRFNLPILPRWLAKRFTRTFLSLTPWQKMQFFAFIWASYLLCFAIMWLGASQAA
ncbi:MAG: hypothetical protein JWP58_3911 [Hymenobacter sp.]|nr:hypothetical protein [Hymenobacter sp.]